MILTPKLGALYYIDNCYCKTEEIFLKTIRLGGPILTAGSAATRFAIDLARKINMTLIEQARQGRMVVYNHGGRIAGL